MRGKIIPDTKKIWILVGIIAGIFFLYLLIRQLFPSFSLVLIFSCLDNTLLLLNEKLANLFLNIFGVDVVIRDHAISFHRELIEGFVPETLYKKWVLVLLAVFLMTKTTGIRKLAFSVLLGFLYLILVSMHIALGARLASVGYSGNLFPAVSLTFGMLLLTTLIFLWCHLNKGNIFTNGAKVLPSLAFLEKKVPAIIGVVYVYVFLSAFILRVFEFQPWISFLFTSAQKILAWLGFQAGVEPHLLVGENGTIYMSKGCLGFTTMLLFASVVYLTGDGNKRKWIYIFSGLIVLNFVNIIRFVLLFIHIQKYGGYGLAMDLHDMYDYIIYTIVFVLWIIWFEKFSDIRGGSLGTRTKKGII